ncbi:hypothetical protein TWF694_005162 [Orbilia ellipsospora]|uniref:Mid2 domain-containing protein n=1 Tax=Orbilia ellipsospora TaxID=2528407 RepID=A0AAV9WUX6_9PEZI
MVGYILLKLVLIEVIFAGGRSVKSPAGSALTYAGWATSHLNPLDPAPNSISCFGYGKTTTSDDGIDYEENFNGRAIIVFGKPLTLTDATFEFAEFTPESSTPRSTPPKSTSSKSSSKSASTSEPGTSDPDSETTTSPSPGAGSATSGARQTTNSNASQSSSSTSSGKLESTGTGSPDPNGGGKSKLGTGAIAGIAVGVGLPVIGIAAFVVYRMRQRKNEVPIVPVYNDPKSPEAGPGGIWNSNAAYSSYPLYGGTAEGNSAFH